MESQRLKAVLIDLDGTLVDTLPEIAATANAMLRDAGREPVSDRAIAEAVGEGSASLVAHLVGREGVEHWLPIYMDHYRRFNGTTGTVYPNATAGLDAMRAAGLRIACVTNKPRELVAPLFEHLGILGRFDCIVGGGDTVDKKPLPAPLLLACERLGVEPAACVMIGDSKNDALAAAAAGMISLTVPYGYPGFGGDADRAEALLERGDTCAIVPDLLEAAAWIAAASATSPSS
jgi:phosphoglycolate phosphatase